LPNSIAGWSLTSIRERLIKKRRFFLPVSHLASVAQPPLSQFSSYRIIFTFIVVQNGPCF
jgi:hypothetical protein